MQEEGNDEKLAIKEAIDTVVTNFTKHTFLHGHGKGLKIKKYLLLSIFN